jgi:hypothetical protein
MGWYQSGTKPPLDSVVLVLVSLDVAEVLEEVLSSACGSTGDRDGPQATSSSDSRLAFQVWFHIARRRGRGCTTFRSRPNRRKQG